MGGAYLALGGWFFVLSLGQFNTGFGDPNLQATLATMAFLMLFIAPLLTMRLMAEEVRQGTLELLLTRPVRDWHVIVGKFLAAWGLMTLLILITTLYAFILVWRGNPDQRVMMSGYLGLWLLSGGMIAVGVLMSSVTQYQLVAGVLTLGALLALWLSNIATSLIDAFATGTAGTFRTVATDVLNNLTIREHFYPSLLRGILNATDIAYFVFLIALSLFLATRVLETRRWRS
jgi:ABC-2 type transport system permease protein